MQKTTKAQPVHSVIDSTKSESELQPKNMRQNLLTGVPSLIQDVEPETPVDLLKEVTTSQFLSRVTASSSSQSAPQKKSSRPSLLAERTLSDASSITDASEAADEQLSKRTAVTINVMPESEPSGEETERSTSRILSGAKVQLSEEEKSSDRNEREGEIEWNE